ncbi:hypothetical protein HDZ31DRAFT_85326 [Schizophyllum fasciatum]
MASRMVACARQQRQTLLRATRSLATAAPSIPPEPTPGPSPVSPPARAPTPADPAAPTHYKITSRRSAWGLGDRTKGTLAALGLHKRHQTVYHAHAPDIAGKILAVKELVEVENVPAAAVRTKAQQRRERAAPRGYTVVGTKRGAWL